MKITKNDVWFYACLITWICNVQMFMPLAQAATVTMNPYGSCSVSCSPTDEKMEIKCITSTLQAAEIIGEFYVKHLRRPADETGLNNWLALFEDGMKLDQIESAIYNSPEAKSKR